MQTQAITVELQLPGIVVLGVRADAYSIEVVAQYAVATAPCPHCRRDTREVYDARPQRTQDADLWGKMVYVLIWKRRFRCRPRRKVFTESVAHNVAPKIAAIAAVRERHGVRR